MRYVGGAPKQIYLLVDQVTGQPLHPQTNLGSARSIAEPQDVIATYVLKRIAKKRED